MNKLSHIRNTPPPSAPSALLKTKTAYSSWFAIFNDFPKIYRYTLGGKIEDYFLALLENIFISIYLPPETKIARLTIAISKLDGVKFFLQIAWENKCVPTEKYLNLSAQLDEIGRMLGGWKKGLEKKTPQK
ncbi:MAG: four helix bundle protein [Patescibacteria group bacterium]